MGIIWVHNHEHNPEDPSLHIAGVQKRLKPFKREKEISIAQLKHFSNIHKNSTCEAIGVFTWHFHNTNQ